MGASDPPVATEHRAGCVLLAQPSQRLSEGLRGWLQSSFDVVVVVADRPSLIEAAHKLQPALVLVDLVLAEGDLAALLGTLRERAPQAHMLLLSRYDDLSVDAAALSAGADGVVHKNALGTELAAAVDTVLAGRRFVAPPVAYGNHGG